MDNQKDYSYILFVGFGALYIGLMGILLKLREISELLKVISSQLE